MSNLANTVSVGGRIGKTGEHRDSVDTLLGILLATYEKTSLFIYPDSSSDVNNTAYNLMLNFRNLLNGRPSNEG